MNRNVGSERERGEEREQQRDKGCLIEDEIRRLAFGRCGRGGGGQQRQEEKDRGKTKIGGIQKRRGEVKSRKLVEP